MAKGSLTRGLRLIAAASAAIAGLLPAAAQASVLTSGNGAISYIADPGERNDVLVSTDQLLGLPVYTFKDADANPISIGGGLCNLVNGVGMCRQDGVSSIYVDVRDGDDTAQIATAGANLMPPPRSSPGWSEVTGLTR